jgi:hypothetical protein
MVAATLGAQRHNTFLPRFAVYSSVRIRIARQGPDVSSYILALDQRTTISRAIPFDREGNVCASANQEFK